MSDYDDAAEAWIEGPAAVYARFAAAMLDHSPVPLAGAVVLDVGAGTAVASDAALTIGARRAVATDVAEQMLRRRSPSIQAAVADAARMPFGDDTFDLVMGAFCLGHLPDPAAALTEWRRVGDAVVATAFGSGPAHPAKTAVDATMERFGFVSPPWYERLKDELEPQVEDPELLESLARSAGFQEIAVTQVTVDAGVRTPADIVRWRWGMAHLAPFVAGLSASQRDEARSAAEEAVAGHVPVIVDIQVLSAAG
jgi:ubiquinone/menaquinone biosynthesis C-methylase UbiE